MNSPAASRNDVAGSGVADAPANVCVSDTSIVEGAPLTTCVWNNVLSVPVPLTGWLNNSAPPGNTRARPPLMLNGTVAVPPDPSAIAGTTIGPPVNAISPDATMDCGPSYAVPLIVPETKPKNPTAVSVKKRV